VKPIARLLLCSLFALPLAAHGAARFAVVVGSNEGAPGRARLWYAEKDAERFAAALRELGDFAPDRIILLQGVSSGTVQAALAAVETRIAAVRAQGERALLVVYFSGHAGAGGLELGAQRIAFDDLRAIIARSSAEAKVAIVDACESGSLTQVKGARPAAHVDFALPTDDSVRGTAFIASTAVGEAAQESAAIGGSFFTHHLEIALRGAGDADGDGHVTLAEAFRYTASRTLSGTASTEAGPQHPTYDTRMSGRGDVVLASLKLGEARLRLPSDPEAQYVLRGPNALVAEVHGEVAAISLALPAGRYDIERRAAEGRSTAQVTLEKGDTRLLPVLTPTRYELARAKGGPVPAEGFVGGGIGVMPLPGFGVAPLVRAGYRRELSQFALRIHADYLRKDVVDQSLHYGFSSLSGAAALLTPIPVGPILLEVGPELGYGFVWQALANGRSFNAGAPQLGGAAVGTFRAGPVRLGLDVSIAAYLFQLDGSRVVRPGGSLALLLLWGM